MASVARVTGRGGGDGVLEAGLVKESRAAEEGRKLGEKLG